MARLLGDQVARAQNVTVVIDNRPGAGEMIGTEAAMRAAPDGNTVLFVANPFVINPHLRKTTYHPLTSFEPICLLTSAPTLIVVHATSPYRTLSDLLDDARKRPGEVTIASIGPGSPFHLGVEELRRAAKADLVFVPYQGNALAVNALLGQHVTAMFGTYSNVAQQLKAGTLRAIVGRQAHRGSSRCWTCRPWPSRDSRITTWTHGSACSHRRRRRRMRLRSSHNGSPPRCRCRMRRRSWRRRGSIRSPPAAPILPRIFAANSTTTAASSAKPKSRVSEPSD